MKEVKIKTHVSRQAEEHDRDDSQLKSMLMNSQFAHYIKQATEQLIVNDKFGKLANF